MRTPSAGMESALLDAASELLEQEGPDALSVRRIAAAAGVAPMGVYNHFASKFGIINALFELGFERLSSALASISSMADPLEALEASGRCYRDLALAQPMMYQLMFLRAVSGFEPSEDALVMAANAFDGLVAAVRRAMDSGQIIEGDATLTAHMLWANHHGWVALELAGMGFVEDQEAGFDAYSAALLKGLQTSP
jgi:AcrR family transcriptional regulator